MNTAPPFATPSSSWSSYTVDKEIRIDPRHPRLARLVERTALGRLIAAFRPTAMRPVELDFHPRRVSGPGLGVLLAGLLLAVAAVADYRNAAAKVEHWRSELARVQQTPAVAPNAAQAEQSATRRQAAATATQSIRRPWETLFSALEAAQDDDIALLGLAPDVAHGAVVITGEGRDREAILAYVERLGESPVLKNVFLVEDQLQQQNPDKPFRFTVSANWLKAP